MQFSLASFYFLLLVSKYFPRQLFSYNLGLFFQRHMHIKQKKEIIVLCVTSLVVPGDPGQARQTHFGSLLGNLPHK